MKLVGIGDLFVPSSYIRTGCQALAEVGVEIETMEWQLDDFDQLQKVNLQIEQYGSDAVEPPANILEKAQQADILVTHFCPITRQLIEACPRL